MIQIVLPSFLLSLVILSLVGHFDYLVYPDKTFVAFKHYTIVYTYVN